MNLEDFDKAQALINQRNHILRAIEECKVFINSTDDRTWWGHLSVHGDGSGAITDLCYCEVLNEVVEATKTVLKDKLNMVDDELIRLGVDV